MDENVALIDYIKCKDKSKAVIYREQMEVVCTSADCFSFVKQIKDVSTPLMM